MSVTVLAGPDGGLYLRIQNDITGEVMGEALTREASATLLQQASATLRCAPLNTHRDPCSDCDFELGFCVCQIAEPRLVSVLDDAMNGRR